MFAKRQRDCIKEHDDRLTASMQKRKSNESDYYDEDMDKYKTRTIHTAISVRITSKHCNSNDNKEWIEWHNNHGRVGMIMVTIPSQEVSLRLKINAMCVLMM